jgi:hypothetical protein
MLPQTKAFALGIVPSSTGTYMLADGSTVTNYLGTATMTTRLPANLPPNATPPAVQSETVVGVVVMCGNGALVGMEFYTKPEQILDGWSVCGTYRYAYNHSGSTSRSHAATAAAAVKFKLTHCSQG